MTKKPLRYIVSSALLVGSLSACGANEHTINEAHPEPEPVANEAEEVEHDPEVNEHGDDPHEHPDFSANEVPPPEPEVSVNPAAPVE